MAPCLHLWHRCRTRTPESRGVVMALPKYTVPSLTPQQGADVAAVLQQRLDALNDLALTLKHIHWNVVGPHFIAVHEMLDPQGDPARDMADAAAHSVPPPR